MRQKVVRDNEKKNTTKGGAKEITLKSRRRGRKGRGGGEIGD
jgi:hypothetical protein